MFTGIITDVGQVTAVETDARGARSLTIATVYDMHRVDLGASIACSGCCLTVVDKGAGESGGWFRVDVSPETLNCTAVGDWAEGTRINLERALKVGDELGGHIVTGHVDGVGEIVSVANEGAHTRFLFRVPAKIAPYIAPKGSVAINGVSLTVNEVEDDASGTLFGVNIIPHTASQTSFGQAKAGDRVHLEIDVLARYVARLHAFNR